MQNLPERELEIGPAGEAFRNALAGIETVVIGGLPISVLDRAAAARLLIRAARERQRGGRPFYSTSANGEVLVQATDPQIGRLFRTADQILADGQPLVMASRWLCRHPLPERVATTDLFHDVARLAEARGVSFYLLGATQAENDRAVAVISAKYPRLVIAGHSHGYLNGEALERKVGEIDRLAPDILWLGLGVPREQLFVERFGEKLGHVGVIKTSGGLFDHISGKNPRAPGWMQKAGLEWLWRTFLEPRRLFWRYFSTNPRALLLMLTRSG